MTSDHKGYANSQLAEIPDPFDPSRMGHIYRGQFLFRCGPRGRLFRSALWAEMPDSKLCLLGLFETQSRGVFNTKENSELRMKHHLLTMKRTGRVGRWYLDSLLIGEMKLSWLLWQFYRGNALVMTREGVVLATLKFPAMCLCNGNRDSFARFVLPANKEIRFLVDPCRCSMVQQKGARLSDFFCLVGSRPTSSARGIFSQDDQSTLQSLTIESRALLLGVAVWARSLFPISVP